jgi:hypothetical protein
MNYIPTRCAEISGQGWIALGVGLLFAGVIISFEYHMYKTLHEDKVAEGME